MSKHGIIGVIVERWLKPLRLRLHRYQVMEHRRVFDLHATKGKRFRGYSQQPGRIQGGKIGKIDRRVILYRQKDGRYRPFSPFACMKGIRP